MSYFADRAIAIAVAVSISALPAVGRAQSEQLSDYAVVGAQSVKLGPYVMIASGNVAVDAPGGLLISYQKLLTGDGANLVSDLVRTNGFSSVYSLFANSLRATGGLVIRASGESGPLPFPPPVFPAFPTVPPAPAGTADVVVHRGLTVTLPAGSYRAGKLGFGSTLVLTGGTYNFDIFRASSSARLLSTAPTTLNINRRADFGNYVIIGPIGTAIQPQDFLINVSGSSVRINKRVNVAARIIAPQAQVSVAGAGVIKGQIVANKVILGASTVVQSAQPQAGPFEARIKSPTPTSTETQTPAFTPTPSQTTTFTPTATQPPTLTATQTLTPTGTATQTPQPTSTSTPLPSNTPVPSATRTPTPTATNTPTPTNTATPIPTATNTPLPTATSTPVPTATNTPVPTATNTPVPTATATGTSTSTPTATNTPVPTATNTPLPTATSTPVPTATNTLVPTATNTPVPTATATGTSTSTPTATNTRTATPTPTDTVASTATATPLPAPTDTPIPPPSPTPSAPLTTTGTPTPAICGDGIVEPGEECDDGNRHDGDGCSSECRTEHDDELVARQFCTLTQGAWSAPAGIANGPQGFLTRYPQILPVAIGGPGRSTTITTQAALQAYMPTGGPPNALNPGSRTFSAPSDVVDDGAGELSGQVVALTLAVHLSEAGGAFAELGDLELPRLSFCTQGLRPGADGVLGTADDELDPSSPVTGPFLLPGTVAVNDGEVEELLVLANQYLRGGNTAASISDINTAVTTLNEAFDGCRRVVRCP